MEIEYKQKQNKKLLHFHSNLFFFIFYFPFHIWSKLLSKDVDALSEDQDSLWWDEADNEIKGRVIIIIAEHRSLSIAGWGR